MYSAMMNRGCAAFILLVMFLNTAGCGPDVRLGQVSGQVTLDGKPLSEARVIFRPSHGRMSQAITGEGGQFELYYTIDRAGALLGNHRVTISTSEPISPSEVTPELVPEEYNVKSTLTAVVKGGENTLDFDLKHTHE